MFVVRASEGVTRDIHTIKGAIYLVPDMLGLVSAKACFSSVQTSEVRGIHTMKGAIYLVFGVRNVRFS